MTTGFSTLSHSGSSTVYIFVHYMIQDNDLNEKILILDLHCLVMNNKNQIFARFFWTEPYFGPSIKEQKINSCYKKNCCIWKDPK